MGLVNWCQDRWLMMMRTKPQYISVFGRKRSSIKSAHKLTLRDGQFGKKFGAFICIVTMFCSVSSGTLLVLSEGIDPSSLTTYLVSIVAAGTVAISSGLCLAEYINNQSQDVPSIYSCCYQYSSEILAFFVGWTWIVSQTAVISTICKVITTHVNEWTDDVPSKFLENVFFDYAKDVPSLIFVLLFTLFILTGFGETVVWYAMFVPIAFLMVVAVYIIGCFVNNSESSLDGMISFDHIGGIDEILSKSTLCVLFFSGPQSLPRVPLAHMWKNTTTVLGPLNSIILIIAFVFITAASLFEKIVLDSSADDMLNLASNILCTIALCTIGIEAFYPLHFTIEDMSSDGLLFRSFSKKWKPFCFPVSSVAVHVIVFISVGLMSVFLTLAEVLNLAAVFPLLVGSIIPYLVLFQRYRDNSSWQYEPMFHTSSNTCQDRSRKKSEEFQYSQAPGFDISEECELSTACFEENISNSASSDTDVDSVVQQYKDQNRIATMSTLDGPISSNPVPEPTPSSSFRAKFCIVVLMAISLIVSLILNFASSKDHFLIEIAVLFCLLLSTAVQSVLMCFPQNQKRDKGKGCCSKIPSMPWSPGMASMMSCSLLLHALIATWKVSLGCFLVGISLYFLNGIHSSTAANSFYNMRTTHITLRPLPSYGNNCIPQIIPSQQKIIKSRKHKKLKTAKL